MRVGKENQGFSLLEVILAIAISILIYLTVTSIYTMSQNVYFKNDAMAEITQNGRVILDRLTRELRQSTDIVTKLPIAIPHPDINPPNEIMFQDGHSASQIQYIRYYIENKYIYRDVIVYYFDYEPETSVYWYATTQPPESNPPSFKFIEEKRIIGEHVDDIEFWGNNLIHINLYLLKNQESKIINTSVNVRNI